MRRRQFSLGAIAVAVASLAVACTASSSSMPSGSLARVTEPASSAAATSGNGAPSPASGPVAVYAHAGAGMLSAEASKARALVYVPNSQSNTVDVIDQRTFKIVGHFGVGALPQHVVPSWNLRTLWVNGDKGNNLVPINPRTGKPGKPVPVADPYNLYFSPDGKHALVMAEALHRLDIRNSTTMKLERSLPVPCAGLNHADFTADGSVMLVSCEFSGKLLVIPTSFTHIAAQIDLNHRLTPNQPTGSMITMMSAGNVEPGATAMPQDVRLTPNGKFFVVADMLRGGIWVIDAAHPRIVRFVPTGRGAHGVYPSRDASVLYVTNRGAGSISVVDAKTLKVRTVWHLPGGGSPDMGGVSADGTKLWLSGRYNGVVYVISTKNGALLHKILVGSGPHGLAVWPQPGRISLGHTGNMR